MHGRIDFRSRIVGRGGAFAAVEGIDAFRQVRIDEKAGKITWPIGVAFCPDALHHEATGAPSPHFPRGQARAEGKRWLRSLEHAGCFPEDVARSYVEAADAFCGSRRTGYWWYLNDAYIQGRISQELLKRRERQLFMPDRLLTDDERADFARPRRINRAA